MSKIFIDTNIPKIRGRNLHTLVREMSPSIKVALMSSYDSTNTNRIVTRDHLDFYLTKPFRISDLEKILREIKSERKTTQKPQYALDTKSPANETYENQEN